MSHPMGKQTICIGENKAADQLRGNREADQRRCFRYSESTIPFLLKSEISSFLLFSVLVQVGLCRTCSETTLLVFPRGGSSIYRRRSISDHHLRYHQMQLTVIASRSMMASSSLGDFNMARMTCSKSPDNSSLNASSSG